MRAEKHAVGVGRTVQVGEVLIDDLQACSTGRLASRELTAVSRRRSAVKNTPLIEARMMDMIETASSISISVNAPGAGFPPGGRFITVVAAPACSSGLRGSAP